MKKIKSVKNLAKIIDHTNIDPEATKKDILKTIKEAKKYQFRGICLNPKWIKFAKTHLKRTKIRLICLIDPPMGVSPSFQRLKIAKKAKKDGADELDVVLNIIDLKYERYNEILKDLKRIARILPTKVIIGSGYLTDLEVKKASELAKKAGAFCVKTATEKDPLEHIELKEKARHLKLMKEAAPGVLIKASGKIKTFKDVKLMIENGADIIGSSSSVKIIQTFKRALKREK